MKEIDPEVFLGSIFFLAPTVFVEIVIWYDTPTHKNSKLFEMVGCG
jgi:hypothetical protein